MHREDETKKLGDVITISLVAGVSTSLLIKLFLAKFVTSHGKAAFFVLAVGLLCRLISFIFAKYALILRDDNGENGEPSNNRLVLVVSAVSGMMDVITAILTIAGYTLLILQVGG